MIIHRKDVSCFLQRWISHRKTGQYWRVDHTHVNSVEPVEAEYEEEERNEEQSMRLEEEEEEGEEEEGEEEEGCCDPDLAELLRMEEEEEHRLADEAHANVCLPDKLLHDENTRWLRECGWPR